MLKRAAGRRKKNYGIDDDDDDEYIAEEDESSNESGSPVEESLDDSDANTIASSASSVEKMSKTKVKSRRRYSSGRRRSRVSDNESEDDDYEDDEDFSPNASEEEDFEEDSLFSSDIVVSAKRGAAKRGAAKRRGTKLKRKVSKTKANRRSRKVVVAPGKRKRRRMTASTDDEDNVRSAMKSHRKNPKKVRKRMGKSRPTKKIRSSINENSYDSDFQITDDDPSVKVQSARNRSRNEKKRNSGRIRKLSKKDSETSDSDFEISEEDLLDNEDVELARVGKSSRDERKNTSTSRKHLSLGFSTGFDDGISDDEVDDVKIDKDLKPEKHEVLSAEKKGKEIEDGDLGKQLCGICLSEEHNGTIQGFLNCCSHYFCFACIMEWSKVESRCPLCKRRFVTITKSSRSGPMFEMRRHVIRVQRRDQVYKPSEEEVRVLLDPYEGVICMECHAGGDDSLMLLCDICDSSAHTYCVGLGNEVPEGNWYCDCCKLAGERSSHSQVLDTREANCGVEEENGSNAQNNSIFQRSVSLQGQSSSQVFDLNAPPRNFVEDSSVSAAQVPGGASTLSGRRAIHQRIRILFSNNRARQNYTEPNRTEIALHTEAGRPVLEQNGEQFHPSERPNSRYSVLSNEHEPGSSRDFPHSDSNLVQQPIKRRNFRHVDGAKEQVQSLVKHCLQKLPREIPLEVSAFKKMARKVTHTILASCEIHYRTSVVSSLVEPPDKCAHDLDGGPVNLLRGCCSACFADYVKYVVKMFVESS